MVDASVDIDAMARKELQALAKTFGIKANQKSVVLRDMIREAIAQQEQSSLSEEDVDAEEKQEEAESLVEDNSKISEDVESTMNQNELNHSAEIEMSDSSALLAPSEDAVIEKEHDCSEAPNEDTVTAIRDDETEIEIGNDDAVGGQIDEIQKEIETKQKQLTNCDKKVLPTKISFSAEKGSIKKHSHLNIYKNEKFTSKLDESFRKSNERKQVRNTNLPKEAANQPTEQGKKASKVPKRDVPLWKVHSRDFMRNQGSDKARDLNSKKKNPLANVQRRPFGDRSNNTIETKFAKKNIEKNDVRRILPKPQAMSKRNEQQMKLFLERQAAGRKENDKRVPPKPLPMSKRNEEQMKRYLERQSVGRKDRARREEVRNYANYVRS